MVCALLPLPRHIRCLSLSTSRSPGERPREQRRRRRRRRRREPCLHLHLHLHPRSSPAAPRHSCLPAEIRLMIYDHAIEDRRQPLTAVDCICAPGSFYHLLLGTCHPLIHVSQLIRAEALATVIRRTRFCLLDGAASLVPFLDCIGQVGRDNVEKVEILWDFGGGPQRTTTTTTTIHKLRGVR